MSSRARDDKLTALVARFHRQVPIPAASTASRQSSSSSRTAEELWRTCVAIHTFSEVGIRRPYQCSARRIQVCRRPAPYTMAAWLRRPSVPDRLRKEESAWDIGRGLIANSEVTIILVGFFRRGSLKLI